MTSNIMLASDARIERLVAGIVEEKPSFDISDLNSPDFSEESRYSGWGWYIPLSLQPLWESMTAESRLVAVLVALELREHDNASAW